MLTNKKSGGISIPNKMCLVRKKVSKYYYTIKDMKWKQLQFRLWYILMRKAKREKKRELNEKSGFKLKFTTSISAYKSYLGKNQFEFLNVRNQFEHDNIDWNLTKNGKLWTYNLNYFEFLMQEDISNDEAGFIINSFWNNRDKLKDGIEPFPISLRTIFWVRYFITNDLHNPKINGLLYAHLQLLIKKIEYHLLGNHLLENGFGLLFGAYYFKDLRFFKKASSILKNELDEQIMEDGAHFEFSPMYHQIMLYRILDCYNLVSNNSYVFNTNLDILLKEKAEIMLGWLKKISWKDGAIPLLNDSTNGIAPDTISILSYAESLNINLKSIPFSDSPYRKWEWGKMELVMDVGDVGPKYIPGHSHSDSLGFLLKYDGQDVFVERGISTYKKNKQRYIERSTASHNTIQIEDKDQSEVWGGFRVARKASTKLLSDKKNEIEAEHNGYQHNFEVIHKRKWKRLAKRLLIQDTLLGGKKGKRTARFHIHPDINVRIKGNMLIGFPFSVEFTGAIDISLKKYTFAEGYNKTREGQLVEVILNTKLTTVIE